MRQVPKYGIVGDGRVARHLGEYFKLLGIPFQQWSRKISNENCESLSDRLGQAEIIFVLIKDSAIESFLQENASFFRHKKAVHFSGALTTALAVGTHPLMSFGPELYSLEEYKKIPFICEKGRMPFEEIFPSFTNPHFSIDSEGKGLYHSLCVLSGNFTTVLWQKFFEEMHARFQIPLEVLQPYLLRTVENIISHPKEALTGPLARQDHGTLKKNLESLSDDASYQKIFRAFVDAKVPDYSEYETTLVGRAI